MSYMFSFQYLLFLCYFWWPRFSLRLLPGQFGDFSCGLCFDFFGISRSLLWISSLLDMQHSSFLVEKCSLGRT